MNSIFTDHLLTWIIAVPFLGMAVLAFVRNEHWIRRIALACTLLDFGLFLILWSGFEPDQQGMQFVERMQWMPTFNIQYAVGVDGISILLVLLTTLLSPLCILSSWSSVNTNVRAFMILILLVEGAMIVVFTAMDLFLFFMMWEITMIPMYFMIILWGGPDRIAAGIKFVLYSLTGSLLLLLGILGLYLEGGRTFDILDLTNHTYSSAVQFWIFLAFFLAFAIKMPMLPFHTWLPDAHSEAPTAGSVLLAGVLLKMGGYGFLRFCLPMLPEASVTFAPFILWLSVAAILYGGYMALAQSDLKKLIAYSSISHMGFVTLGFFLVWSIASETGAGLGLTGGMVQMISHGFISGAMFLCVGVLYDRMHSRQIADYGGVVNTMPKFATFFVIFALANAGLPGTSGFVGEFMVILASFKANVWYAFLAALTLILGAAYTLWMLKRVVFGEVANDQVAKLVDLNQREFFCLLVLTLLVLWIGLWPAPLIEMMDVSVSHLLQQAQFTNLK